MKASPAIEVRRMVPLVPERALMVRVLVGAELLIPTAPPLDRVSRGVVPVAKVVGDDDAICRLPSKFLKDQC